MYTFTIITLASSSFVNIFAQKKKIYYILWCTCFLLLVIHDGLRWETGTDWIPYSTFFEKCLDISNQSDFEFGYLIISQLVRIVTNEYTVFLIIHAIILYSLVFSSIKKYSITPLLSLFLYYCMTLPLLGMNRQFIALAICLFSIRYIVERKMIYFFCGIVLAMLFHKSAIMFFIVYFLNKEWKRSTYLVILLIAFLIAISGIINKLPLNLFLMLGSDSAARMDFYTNKFLLGDININPVYVTLAVMKRMFWILLLILYPFYVKNKNNYYVIMLNINVISLVFYILFNNTILQIIISRGLIYFNIAEIFIIPYILTMFKNNRGKIIAFILILAFGLINMKKGIDSYSIDGEQSDLFIPYKGLFINNNYVRQDH